MLQSKGRYSLDCINDVTRGSVWGTITTLENIDEAVQQEARKYISYGDFLTDRGWVLLHNPSQGIAIPTTSPGKRYTKAQKEFLYQYFIDRNCEKEANEIWED